MIHVVRRSGPHLWALVFVLCARSAAAQSPAPQESTPPQPSVQFLPHALFHLSAEHLSGQDESFQWDANFGADLDVVDYGSGRASFVANYQVIMGDEFRRFDPNQGNYVLGGSTSLRRSGYEFAGVFHHESRHLSDRANRVAVAWNMAGGRISRAYTFGSARLDAGVDVRTVVAKSFVDYDWEIEGGARGAVQLHPHVAVLFAGDLRLLGVDGSQNRGDQTGFRLETGVHLSDGGGAAEFFISAERRIDPYPLEFGTINFVTVGFRLLSH